MLSIRLFKKLVALLSLVLWGMCSFAQNYHTILSDIRKEYQLIQESLVSCDTTTMDVEGSSTEGGELTAFIQKEELKLIQKKSYYETGKTYSEFYFRQDSLVFLYTIVTEYNRPIYWNEYIAEDAGDSEAFDPAKSTAREYRYYFYRGRLFRFQDEEGQVFMINEPFLSDMQVNISMELDELRAILKL